MRYRVAPSFLERMLPITRNSFCATLALMTVSWGSALCNLMEIFHSPNANPSTDTKITTSPPNHYQRNLSVNDVMLLIRTVVKTSNGSVTLSYGQEYEEVVNKSTILVAEEFIVLMKFKNDGKMGTFRQILSLSERNNFLLLLDTPANIVSLFQMMRKALLKTHLTRWLLLMEGSDADNSVIKLQEFVNEGTQVVPFVKTFDGHMVYFLPSVNPDGVTQFMNKGKWESSKDLKETFSKDPQQNLYNLSGRKFRVSIKEVLQIVNIGRHFPDGSVELLSGLDVEIINILSSALNFTYKAFIPQDNVWGDALPNGNVTGIIGMVARREAVIGASVLSISASRLRVVDFTCPYITGMYLLMSRSPKEKNRALAVLSPFQLQVWIGITLTVLLIGPIVYLISYVVNKYVTIDGKAIDYQWFHLNMFRNVVNQGNFILEESLQVRVVLAFWFLFCLINAALYSGMLTAVLAIPAYETPIDFLRDLPRATKEGFTVGTIGDSNYETFFKTATEGIFKQTWDLFNHEDRSRSFVKSAFEGVKRVLEEKFVFITSDNYGTLFKVVFGKERIYLSKERFLPSHVGFACQRGSPIIDALTLILLKMKEGGIMDRVADESINNSTFGSICQNSSSREKECLNYLDTPPGCLLYILHRNIDIHRNLPDGEDHIQLY
ncbi:probable glutamate receptor isoform X3 [Palaemon carinicauda]|uniref:probable glutamate receptor isoform X3 n=1 Tax=Palaemon carinicauda TaxID=392227 RepID=UPI0035B5F137